MKYAKSYVEEREGGKSSRNINGKVRQLSSFLLTLISCYKTAI